MKKFIIRSEIKTFIHSYQHVQVTFEKKDGSTRNLLGTVKRELIPSENLPSSDTTRKPPTPNPDIIKIYDVANKGWRSIRILSVEKLTGVDAEGNITETVEIA